ncbi:hypothetical protein CEUSTIGMA_g3317.t1 [Chlamydomonas eustigma]|uniref:SGNH hydrolase-type esterase domain-containing protein n=1 Tax=Chlamydomonas eustigma TaxID=1157962 RepID=A0A250WYF1_9CHLO|nr:hypothetical protein CEUSTIGMA_g3317.t1 [Chlamydomonas eustigma]|eukprot:GAX75874.1 hypothetical protein CEUSTIGMA_g3317.t1 [Chlamydomonas eustigma]
MATVLLFLLAWNYFNLIAKSGGSQEIESPEDLRSLPSDIESWNYSGMYEPEKERSSEGYLKVFGHQFQRRWWDHADLRSAFVTSDFKQMRPFLAKLHAGRPVSVVAYGDSIVEKHGGCFHRDMEQLGRHGVQIPGGVYYRSHCTKHAQTRWLTAFMHLINTTWPHPEHLLVNNGLAGTPINGHSEASCVEFTLPTVVDLIILEQLLFTEDDQIVTNIERLVNRIWLHAKNTTWRGPIPVIIINMDRARHTDTPAWLDNTEDHCLRDGSKCSKECPNSFSIPQASFTHSWPKAVGTHEVARHHGMASIDFKPLVGRIFKKLFLLEQGGSFSYGVQSEQTEDRGPLNISVDLGPEPTNKKSLTTTTSLSNTSSSSVQPGSPSEWSPSHCEYFAAMYRDNIHPGLMGGLLLADLLTSYLADADLDYRLHHEQQHLVHITHPTTMDSIVDAASIADDDMQPISHNQPLVASQGYLRSANQTPESTQQEHLVKASQISSDSSSIDARAPAVQTALFPWLSPQSVILPHSRCYGFLVRPSGSTWFNEGTDVSQEAMLPMHVALKEGWTFVENEGGAEGKTVYKPGWTAYQPVSKLEVEVNTDFSALHGSEPSVSEKVDIMVTYLSSYEHMGQAELRCVSNCVCEKRSLDGHEPQWKFSLPRLITLPLLVPHAKCVVQVEVLNTTRSGEYKVKVMQLTVSTMWNAYSDLMLMYTT